MQTAHSLHGDNLASYSYVTVSNSYNVYIVVKTKIFIYRVLKKVDFTKFRSIRINYTQFVLDPSTVLLTVSISKQDDLRSKIGIVHLSRLQPVFLNINMDSICTSLLVFIEECNKKVVKSAQPQKSR